MTTSLMEKYEASDRLAEFFDINFEFDWKKIFELEAVCYGKIDPIHADDIPEIIRKLGEGEYGTENTSRLFEQLQRNKDTNSLINYLEKLRPQILAGNKQARIVSYLVHTRLTELGVAPRWRNVKKPTKPTSAEWNDYQKKFMCDLQVFDMHWVYLTKPKHRAMNVFNGVFEKLYDADEFDFTRAQILAHGEITIKNKIKFLKLNEDNQAELNMLRSPTIERAIQKIDRNAERVEADLRLAANRNRHRGSKLLAVIPDKLMVWKSTVLIPTNSIAVMHENYEKLSANKISRSTYVSKLKSLDKALAAVNSVFVLDFL